MIQSLQKTSRFVNWTFSSNLDVDNYINLVRQKQTKSEIRGFIEVDMIWSENRFGNYVHVLLC
jgi:hypothetical protein